MQKKVLIGVSICVVVLFIFGSSTDVSGYQTIQSSNQKTMKTYDGVDVVIRAGRFEKTNGNYGLGLLIIIKNNLIAENIEGNLKVYWEPSGGKNLKTYNTSFNLVYGAEVKYEFHDRSYFLFPIVKLTVMVGIPQTDTFALRSGIQIGRFVFF